MSNLVLYLTMWFSFQGRCHGDLSRSCDWAAPVRDQAIPLYNLEELKGLSVGACKEACEHNLRCKSTDYTGSPNQTCYLNEVNKYEVPLTSWPGCDYYEPIDCIEVGREITTSATSISYESKTEQRDSTSTQIYQSSSDLSGNSTQTVTMPTTSLTTPSKRSSSIECSGDTARNTIAIATDSTVTQEPLEFQEWMPWTPCPVTCGGGIRMTFRICPDYICHYIVPSTMHNFSYDIQWKYCAQTACPSLSYWSAWTAWSACSSSCGAGTQGRTRECLGQVNVTDCQGSDRQTQICHLRECEIYVTIQQRRKELLSDDLFTESDYQTSAICLSFVAMVVLCLVLLAVLLSDLPLIRSHVHILLHNIS